MRTKQKGKASLKSKINLKKVSFTLLVIFLVRFLYQVSVPGINPTFLNNIGNQFKGSEILNVLLGGALNNFSFMLLGVTPYITASIIIQLLTVAFPSLKDKEPEQHKKYTRYTTVGLAFIQSFGIALSFNNSMFVKPGPLSIIVATLTLTAGAFIIVWLADKVTDHGVGQGMSVMIAVNILSQLPIDVLRVINRFSRVWQSMAFSVFTLLFFACLTLFIIMWNDSEYRVPLSYGKNKFGTKNNSYLPIKLAIAGVTPVIYASTIASIPQIISTFTGKTGMIYKLLTPSYWFKFGSVQEFIPSLGIILYILMIIFFSLFYAEVFFNEVEISNNIQKQGGVIPGVRPGRPTAEHIGKIKKSIILVGSAGLVVIWLMPYLFSSLSRMTISLGGTSLIIVASVLLESYKELSDAKYNVSAQYNRGGFL